MGVQETPPLLWGSEMTALLGHRTQVDEGVGSERGSTKKPGPFSCFLLVLHVFLFTVLTEVLGKF